MSEQPKSVVAEENDAPVGKMFDYIVNREKIAADAPYEIRQNKLDRKINLKLVKSDVQILDFIAEHYNVPRSVIVNEFLNSILTKDFKKIPDADTQLLIARAADSKVFYSDMERSWESEAQPVNKQFDRRLTKRGLEIGLDVYPYSDSFKHIYDRLHTADFISFKKDTAVKPSSADKAVAANPSDNAEPEE